MKNFINILYPTHITMKNYQEKKIIMIKQASQ